jgi:hypothetical protein
MDTNRDGQIDTHDQVAHSFLDSLVGRSFDGNSANTSGTTKDFRYEYVHGAHLLAVPTVGVMVGTEAQSSGMVAGTSYTDRNFYSTLTQVKSTDTLTQPNNYNYTDLAAIWDAFNGNTTGTNIAGVPTGWMSGNYWAADQIVTGTGNQAVSSHLAFSLETGAISTILDNPANTAYVVLQVV